eukprot:TRINITY_DN1023_c0_g1_i7.p1 TRINITY_DN1023_c0_g1~~TRINITY_DN1023_c0_g1_i7.p1  ORF type:complete len:202 (-),score=9.50 TRINITY_DN1023_c0_g1_i7:63-668(-)
MGTSDPAGSGGCRFARRCQSTMLRKRSSSRTKSSTATATSPCAAVTTDKPISVTDAKGGGADRKASIFWPVATPSWSDAAAPEATRSRSPKRAQPRATSPSTWELAKWRKVGALGNTSGPAKGAGGALVGPLMAGAPGHARHVGGVDNPVEWGRRRVTGSPRDDRPGANWSSPATSKSRRSQQSCGASAGMGSTVYGGGTQ